jgi:hypothetical protein
MSTSTHANNIFQVRDKALNRFQSVSGEGIVSIRYDEERYVDCSYSEFAGAERILVV